MIDWFGPTDLLQMNKQAVEGARMDHDAANSPESLLVGGPIQEEPYRNVAVKANPITYVDGNEPPFLLVHGDRDLSVSHRQSILLHEALKAVGVDSTLQIVKGGSHGFREGEKTAEEERGKALEQEALALKTLASSRIALAERELLAGNVREAELLLQQVPDSSRNSNWEFIDRHLYQEEERYDSWSSEMGGYIEMSSDGNRIFYERGGNRGYAMAELKGAMSWRPITRNEKIKPGIMSLGNKDEWLLYVSQSDEIVVVDWVRNKELFRRKYEGPILTRVALSPSGSQYVLASNQGQRVATHSTESGELLWEAKGREPIAFSPDGELVGFREDGTGFDINVRIHESASGKRSFSIGAPNLGSYGGQKNKAMKNWLLIDRKGSRIQLLSENFLYNWIPSNRRNLPLSRGKPKALSPDGRLLVSTEGNRVYLLDARRNELIREWSVMELGNWGIGRIRFSNEGQRILFLSPDRGLGSWDTGWRVPLFDGLGYAGPDGGGVDGTRKISLSFSNDGQYLLYSDLLKVHRWNLSDGLVSQIFEVSRKEKGYSNLNGLVLLPRTGRIALSIRGREEMQLVSEDTFEVVEEIREKSLAPLASQLSFSKNEDVFLVVQYRWNDKEQVGGQPLVSVYSTEGASLLFETAWKKGEANSLAAFCHDDQWIVAGGVVDGMKNMGLEFWDWRKNERVRQLFPEQTGSIVSMHVSGDGSRIATGTHKGWIRIWDVESGAMAVEFRAHWKAVSSILYSPDVNDVITGGHDGSVRIHDAATGEEKRVFYGHADPVNSLAISPDGRLVASSSWFGNRGSIKVWRITDGYVPRKGGRPEIIRLTREDIE